VKGYVKNKAYLEGSIAEGYIVEECLTFCSKFLNVDTKLNRPEHHENMAMNEPPLGLSIFADMDYKRRGKNIDQIGPYELRKMRHYIITNREEASDWIK
jgi:hypothetical protein